MFRVDIRNPLIGPHQNGTNYTAGADPDSAKAAMILLHGRGATAQSILGLAAELNLPELHYVAPQADQSTWYPYSFLEPVEQNQPGLNSALQVIHDLLSGLEEKGFGKEQILLAGFSQGACLASEFAARHPARYGGVAALSGGLIGSSVAEKEYTGSLDGTPVFLGCSDVDPHIPLERVNESEQVFTALKADVKKKIYRGMAHTVNRDELEVVRKMVQSANSA